MTDKNTELIEMYLTKLNTVHGQIRRTTAMFYILCCAQLIMVKQVWTSEELFDKFDKLTKDEKISTLYEAIGIMQMANWQSTSRVIFRAMGYNDIKGDGKEWRLNKHSI